MKEMLEKMIADLNSAADVMQQSYIAKDDCSLRVTRCLSSYLRN